MKMDAGVCKVMSDEHELYLCESGYVKHKTVVSNADCGWFDSLVGLKTGVHFGHHLWEPDVSAYWRVSCCK